jgi:hypothetical protein
MTVIARDTVAADHLVYPWPLPIGVECEVACGDDDAVVMCPAWLVGDRLGPGRHHWRTPDPSRPTSAYFVRSTPVEVAFDMATTFMLPPTVAAGAPIRCRLLASGAVQVRCADPGLLVAQFVGLPFDGVNDGLLRSVSRSVERMLARLLTRRVVITGSAASVTDPGMLPHLIDELVAYNPAAGAVFGIELIRVSRLGVDADDGVAPNRAIHQTAEWGRVGRNGEQITAAMPIHRSVAAAGAAAGEASIASSTADSDLDVTLRSHRAVKSPDVAAVASTNAHIEPAPAAKLDTVGETLDEEPSEPPARASMSQTMRHAAVPAPGRTPPAGVPVDNATPPLGQRFISASGEIVLRPSAEILARPPPPTTQPEPARTSSPALRPPSETSSKPTLSGIPPIPIPNLPVRRLTPPDVKPVKPAAAKPGEAKPDAKPPAVRNPDDESTPPSRPTPRPPTAPSEPAVVQSSGEIAVKVAPGTRVRVPGADGALRSAIVRQLLQGYYELDVGAGETIWVPMSRIVPE